MREHFVEYLTNLYNYLPGYVFDWFVWLFCIGALLQIVVWGFKKGFCYSLILLLLEYVVLIFCSTVIFRNYREPAGVNLHPFWSYGAIIEGHTNLLNSSIMNILVFVPLGFLFGCCIRNLRWWKVLLVCGFISILIETLQFLFERGFTEVDDVIHNILGGLLGFGLSVCVVSLYKKLKIRLNYDY